MVDELNCSALHYAARCSSAKICEILIENGCDVKGSPDVRFSPLTLCSIRWDAEALKVAKLLIERGADLAEKDKKEAATLHRACFEGSDEMVQFLVDSKADVNAEDINGTTPLMRAAHNRCFGEKIIPILIQAGADVTVRTESCPTVVMHAFCFGGGKILKALAPFIPEGWGEELGLGHAERLLNPDPIGSMAEGLAFGFEMDFDCAVSQGNSPAYCWAMLRGQVILSNVFQTLSNSDNLDLWCYCATELWHRGHAVNSFIRETILQLAVRCNKLTAEDKLKIVQHIFSFHINPLVVDITSKRAIDYCTKEERELYNILAEYQRWKPEKNVMDWYGKSCRERFKTFLLVEKRLQLGLPRDLRHLILSYVAEIDDIDETKPDFSDLFESADLNVWLEHTTRLWHRGQALDAAVMGLAFDDYTWETILHLAVRCQKLSQGDKIKVVQHIMSFFINPFVLDNDNKRAIDYCTKEESELYDLLAHYQQWKPEKKVMDWYGPYCRGRLRAFLLVEQRLKVGYLGGYGI
jgi:ankyrin repeat protein